MKHFEYENRLTKKKNQKEIEKEICESLGFDLKTSHLINEGKYQIKDDVMIHNAIDKLGQLEDIEQELGIDLITLFKAMTAVKYDDCFYGEIYAINSDNNSYPKGIYKYCIHTLEVGYAPFYMVLNCFLDEAINGYHWNKSVRVSDYKLTWALTKEEINLNEAERIIESNSTKH